MKPVRSTSATGSTGTSARPQGGDPRRRFLAGERPLERAALRAAGAPPSVRSGGARELELSYTQPARTHDDQG